MPSLWDPGAGDRLVARVRALTPDRKPLWGRMSCPQMVAHVSDTCRLYLGELPAAAQPSVLRPLRYAPFKQIVVYVLPFPKGVTTAPELLARAPGDWNAEIDALCDLVVRLAAARECPAWPEHPIFGTLSPRAWGVLAWRHTDHHLRQFDV